MNPIHPPRRVALAALLLSGALAVTLAAARAAEHPDAPPPTAASSDEAASVVVANLIYGGTRSSVCFSDKFLSTLAAETSIQTARKFKPVKLADADLFRYPFAVMTGEGAFTLTDAERENLKRYLERGGFLLASAGCSSTPWGESFTTEIQRIFPDRALADIPTDHEIFRTVHEVPQLKTKAADATLRGLMIDDKIVLVYSSDGLNDTSTMHGCCCCGGNEILNAQQVNANILAYALLQ